jgi:hypothetical protein
VVRFFALHVTASFKASFIGSFFCRNIPDYGRGEPAIHKQLLFDTVTDASFDTYSYKQFAKGYFLSREGMQWFWDQYMTDREERTQITASPLRAYLASNRNACQTASERFRITQLRFHDRLACFIDEAPLAFKGTQLDALRSLNISLMRLKSFTEQSNLRQPLE